MKLLVTLCTTCCFALIGCQSSNSLDSQPNQLSEANSESRVICKKIKVTGSRLPIRQCGTKKEWDEETRKSKERMRQMQANQKAPNLTGQN